MISLEQVKLLESKVTRTIDYVKKVIDENKQLKEKLASYQNRIDELEVLVSRFKQDQNRIEDGILSALDRLNQFEGAVENLLSSESKPAPVSESKPPLESKPAPVVEDRLSEKPSGKPAAEPARKEEQNPDPGELDIF